MSTRREVGHRPSARGMGISTFAWREAGHQPSARGMGILDSRNARAGSIKEQPIPIPWEDQCPSRIGNSRSVNTCRYDEDLPLGNLEVLEE